MEEAVFRGVKRVCYAGLDSVTLRREVAARIAPAVSYDAYAFSTTDPDTGLLTHMLVEGVPAPMVAAYCAHFYPHEAAVITLDMVLEGHPVFSMMHQSREIASACRASGLRYEAHVDLAVGENLWGTFCLLRRDASDALRRRARALLERVAPHVARGLQTASLIERGLEDRGADGAAAAPAVVVLDPRGRATVRTEAAIAYLDDLADVGIVSPGGIPLAITSAVERVRRMQARAEPDERADVVLRARGRSDRWYTIRAMLAEPDAAGDVAAIVVVQPSTPRERAAILTRLYDLSRREREVTAAVARGESTKRIAARLGVSPHTVKEHLDRACAKIGVRGRKALVAKLFFDGYAPGLAAERRHEVPRAARAARAPASL
ncbi:MAG TPA: LuxR C-terminal-related transcriptional regulator [Longimicrobiales bacterium]|nr:LuxR C-terminal-related transcriptional regulator [Longimicrobiales bacterium]